MNYGDWVAGRKSPAVLWVLACALVGGCGSDPSDTAEQADKTLRAWSATLRVAAEQWVDRRVPDLYFRQVIEAARESLDEQAKTLSKKLPASDGRRKELETRLADLRQRLGQLTNALEHSDRAAAQSTSRALASAPALSAAPRPGGAAS